MVLIHGKQPLESQGPALGIESNLDHVLSQTVREIRQRGGRGGHSKGGLKMANPSVQRGSIDQGLVPLDIEDPAGLHVPRGFGNAVGSGRVVGLGHSNLRTESLCRRGDTVIICGDQHLVDQLGLLGALPNPLKEGFAQDRGEGFSRKAGGTVPGGYDGKNRALVHAETRVRETIQVAASSHDSAQ